MDDCSTDESRSIISEYAIDSRVRTVFNAENSGSIIQEWWNKGVRMGTEHYVWIAESDDYADKWLLEELVSRFDADPNAVFSYGRSWRVSGEGLGGT